MDLRKEKSSHYRTGSDRFAGVGGPGGPGKSYDASRDQQSPLRKKASGDRYGPSSRERDASDPGYPRDPRPAGQRTYGDDRQRITPYGEEGHRIEQRHEELRKQILLKEQQLAALTSERDTATQLRSKLGMQKGSQHVSDASLMHEERGREPPWKDTRRTAGQQHLSVSPHANQMVGLRSSHYRPTSSSNRQNITDFNLDHTSSRRDYGQPLAFHPTRMARQETTQPQQQPRPSRSPLRSRSRSDGRSGSRGRSAGPYVAPSTRINNLVADYTDSLNQSRPIQFQGDTLNPNERRASYERDGPPRDDRDAHATGQRQNYRSSSPLRSRSPPGEHRGLQGTTPDTSAMQSRDLIKPLPVESGSRPMLASTFDNTNAGYSLGSHMRPVQAASHTRTMPPMLSGPDARSQLYKDRIEAMMGDNESLQRRLNQVSRELERILKEKGDLANQLNIYSRDNGIRETQVNQKDETDMSNQGMQLELERQKEDNLRLTSMVRDTENGLKTADGQLVSTNAAKSNLEFEKGGLGDDFSKKLARLDLISRQKADTITNLNRSNIELDRLNNDERVVNHQNIDLDKQVQRLQNDRQELLRNLQNLTVTFDDCVRDIGRERRNMDAQNDRQTKLIVAKVLFQNLELAQAARQQVIFSEIASYTTFDKNCQLKLRNFANAMNRVGRNRQKKALNQWYDKALKPLALRVQNDDISIMINFNRLQAKVFYALKQYMTDKTDRYYFKTNAIEKIWYLLKWNAKCELKTALQIWKEAHGFDNHKLRRFRALIRKQNQDNLSYCVNTWRSFGKYMEYQCRVKVTHMEFTQKLFLSQLFSQMRGVIRTEKRQRIRRLNVFLKAWRDYIYYNRHLMQVNMAAIQFGKVNREFIVRNCFAQLRQNREDSKYALIHKSLREDVDVAIAKFGEANRDKQSAMLTESQRRAGDLISEMLGKGFYSYFYYWRGLNRNFKIQMNTKVKDQLVKLYKGRLKASFVRWRDACFRQIRGRKMQQLQELKMQCEQNQLEAHEQEGLLRAKGEQLKSSQSRMADKTFRKLLFRKLGIALGRWKDICNTRGTQEQHQLQVLLRWKNRLLRQAFDRYLEFFNRSTQRGRNLSGCEYMKEVLRQRLMKKYYNGICQMAYRNQQARKYWWRILNKVDRFMKRRAIKIWSDNAHLKRQFELNGDQGDVVSELQRMNEIICGYEQDTLNQEAHIAEQMKLQTNKAYRQIGNYFMRSYMDQIGQKFKFWKDEVHQQIHKERIIKRTIYHWRKQQLEGCRQVFRKFVHDDRSNDAKERIKRTILDQETLEQEVKNNDDLQSVKRQRETAAMVQSKKGSDLLEERYLNLIKLLSRRNREWAYCSKKRSWFCMGRHVVRQEIAFVQCVKDVLTKSLHKRGFDKIYKHYRALRKRDLEKKHLTRLVVGFSRIMRSDAFTRMKYGALHNVEGRRLQVLRALEGDNRDFDEAVERAKDANNARCFKVFMDKNKANVFRAWLNVIKFFKLQKAKTVELHARQTMLRRTCAVRRWKSRWQKTKFSENRRNQLKYSFGFKYYRAAFYALKADTKSTSRFLKSLSNFERMMRHKAFIEAFKGIKGYARSRGLVSSNNRAQGAEQVLNLVMTAFLEKLAHAFQRFKQRTAGNSDKSSTLRKVWGRVIGSRMRDAFNWWRVRDSLKELAIDLHEAGPVRVDHWEQEREIENLKAFMRAEHYTEDQVEEMYDKVKARTEGVMRKHMMRLRIGKDPSKRLLSVVWNRWRYFVGNLKLLKYQLRTCYNNAQSRKADLQRAFKKWRNGPDQLAKELWQLPYATVKDLGLKASREVQDCGDQLAENHSIQNHLMIQRDEFLNYYIKSQVLAMALVKDKVAFVEMQAISRWTWKCGIMLMIDMAKETTEGQKKGEELARQKKDLEARNAELQKENGDMRGFTGEQGEIRANMLRLKADRDKLAQRLADSDQDLKDLLEEKKRLEEAVKDAQFRAETQPNQRYKALATLKEAPAKPPPAGETEQQKQMRERFEKLQKISQGASLR